MSRRGGAIVVGVCTRGRPEELRRLLRSLAWQDTVDGARILVVDNDPGRAAEAVVEDARTRTPVPIDYVAESRVGFASVRNAALDAVENAESICFLDDDAVVPSGWLNDMHRAHLDHPAAIVRSRYAHVPEVPTEPVGVARAVDGLGPITAYGPAGTSGLLLPMGTLGGLRFDPYYDESGGEDLDLLIRLEQAGAETVIADTVVLERQRVGVLPLEDQLRLARWNGRLSMIIRIRAGRPTGSARWRARGQALSAITRATAARVLRREAAYAGYRGLAAGRWAAATAPREAPAALGPRPVL